MLCNAHKSLDQVQWLFYTPFRCTLPRTFTYQACPFSLHCLSFNALPAEIRTRNHGISTVLMFLRINLITNWGKFCTCCCLRENFALVPNRLIQKELMYGTLASPHKTQTNKTQYVEANEVGYRNLPAGG